MSDNRYDEEHLYVHKYRNEGGGGGGTTDYNDLENKPSINGVTIQGALTAEDLGLARAHETSIDNLFLVKAWYNQVNFSVPLASISSRVSTEIATVLSGLSDDEYITIEQLLISNLVNITPDTKVILKKGDVIPTIRLQGMNYGSGEIVFVDVNNAVVAHFATSGTIPASDYEDDYSTDVTPLSCTLVYNKYQKGA